MGFNENGQAKKSFISRREIIRLESTIRKKVHHSLIYNFISSSVASILVFVFYLLSIEFVISIVLTVSLTIYAYRATVRLKVGRSCQDKMIVHSTGVISRVRVFAFRLARNITVTLTDQVKVGPL
jgi:predicted membrane channel-forming protein YqfA (hemolysin III family)